MGCGGSSLGLKRQEPVTYPPEFEEKYTLGEKVGQGGFGTVYELNVKDPSKFKGGPPQYELVAKVCRKHRGEFELRVNFEHEDEVGGFESVALFERRRRLSCIGYLAETTAMEKASSRKSQRLVRKSTALGRKSTAMGVAVPGRPGAPGAAAGKSAAVGAGRKSIVMMRKSTKAGMTDDEVRDIRRRTTMAAAGTVEVAQRGRERTMTITGAKKDAEEAKKRRQTQLGADGEEAKAERGDKRRQTMVEAAAQPKVPSSYSRIAAFVDRYREEAEQAEGDEFMAKAAVMRLRQAEEILDEAVKATLVAEVENEVRLLQRLHHPKLLHLNDFFQSANCFVLVTEKLHGELKNAVVQQGLARFGFSKWCGAGEAAARRVASDLTAAIAYLHGREVVHRDLKAENVLLRAAPENWARIDAQQKANKEAAKNDEPPTPETEYILIESSSCVVTDFGLSEILQAKKKGAPKNLDELRAMAGDADGSAAPQDKAKYSERDLQRYSAFVSGCSGSVWWLAPELMRTLLYSLKRAEPENPTLETPDLDRMNTLAYPLDVWAVGAIVYYTLTGHYVFGPRFDEKNEEIESPFEWPDDIVDCGEVILNRCCRAKNAWDCDEWLTGFATRAKPMSSAEAESTSARVEDPDGRRPAEYPPAEHFYRVLGAERPRPVRPRAVHTRVLEWQQNPAADPGPVPGFSVVNPKKLQKLEAPGSAAMAFLQRALDLNPTKRACCKVLHFTPWLEELASMRADAPLFGAHPLDVAPPEPPAAAPAKFVGDSALGQDAPPISPSGAIGVSLAIQNSAFGQAASSALDAEASPERAPGARAKAASSFSNGAATEALGVNSV